jgi:hypothetical protein
VDDKTIGAILWLVFLAVAGIAKLLSKFMGHAATVRKVAEAGKQAKSVFDVLLGDNLEELKRALSPEEESKPTPPAPPPAERASVAPVAERTAAPPQPRVPAPSPILESRSSVTARPTMFAAQRARRLPKREEIRPPEPSEEEGPPRPLSPLPAQPVPVAAPMLVPATTETSIAARELLRRRDARTLREMIVLSEILGPPKALARRR